MTLWQAVADREAQLRGVWDSGPGGPRRARADGRARLGPARPTGVRAAAGRASPLALSVPEACRLPTPWSASCANGSGSTPPAPRPTPGSPRCAPSSSGCATRPPSSRRGRRASAPASRSPRSPDAARRRRSPRPSAAVTSAASSARSRSRPRRWSATSSSAAPDGARPAPSSPASAPSAPARAARDRPARARATLRRDGRRGPALRRPRRRRARSAARTPRRALAAYEHRLGLVARALGFAEEAYARALRDHDDRVARLDALRVGPRRPAGPRSPTSRAPTPWPARRWTPGRPGRPRRAARHALRHLPGAR